MDDLVGAMAISPSSFYAAVGGKERLCLEAVDAYAAEAVAWITDGAADAATALRRGAEAPMAARIRRGIADGDTPPDADAFASFHGAALRGAAAVAFLASDDASWITGETLKVAGGYGM